MVQLTPVVKQNSEVSNRIAWYSIAHVFATKTLYAAGGGTLDTQYYYREEFNVSTLADGTFSISLTSLGSEFTFPFGSTATQLN